MIHLFFVNDTCAHFLITVHCTRQGDEPCRCVQRTLIKKITTNEQYGQ